MTRPVNLHRALLLDDLEQAGAVHILNDEKMQVAVLVNVMGANDVRVIEGGRRPGLAVEPAERRGLLGLRGWEHLDGHPPAHVHMLAQKHLPHSAESDPLEELVLADRKPAPFPEHELLGLEVSQEPVTDHRPGELAHVRHSLAAESEPFQVGVEAGLVDHPALANELEQVVESDGGRHRGSPWAANRWGEAPGPYWRRDRPESGHQYYNSGPEKSGGIPKNRQNPYDPLAPGRTSVANGLCARPSLYSCSSSMALEPPKAGQILHTPSRDSSSFEFLMTDPVAPTLTRPNLTAIEPAARAVPVRALRRVIRACRDRGDFDTHVLHTRSWWVNRDRLFSILTPWELGLSPTE